MYKKFYNIVKKKRKQPKKGSLITRIQVGNKLRQKVLENYNSICGYCLVKVAEPYKPLQLHHIDEDYTNTIENNLIPLCLSCHRKTQWNKIEMRNFFMFGIPVPEKIESYLIPLTEIEKNKFLKTEL